MATTYFGIESTDLTDELCPDTDMSSGAIAGLAQRIEYSVMNRLQLSAAPTDTVDLEDLKLAIIYLTAGDIESREPHSRADGSIREDKFSRVLWKSAAEDIIRRFERVLSKT